MEADWVDGFSYNMLCAHYMRRQPNPKRKNWEQKKTRQKRAVKCVAIGLENCVFCGPYFVFYTLMPGV